MTDTKPKLHPAEHRAYRELYASARQLINRWRRLAPALEGTAIGDSLKRGVTETEMLVAALEPRTAAYDLHGGPMAQGLGARIAGLRSAVADRGGDTGMVIRFAVLDMEHLTTLLRHLAELARSRQDRDLAGFCEEWAGRLDAQLGAVREAAVELGTDPNRAAAPLDDSLLNRAAHGVGWVFGSVGEGIDRVVGRRRRR
ncbi:MAG: hypothetical protein WB771_15555 [Solirubrobacterales bacterium]